MANNDIDTGGTRCGNCQAMLAGPYCHQCGQPIKGLIRPLSGWFADFLDGVVQWDGRIPRTITPLLFRQGVLTREYIAGRRVRYVTPVRLFLFLIVILFLAVNWIADISGTGVSPHTLAPAEQDVERVQQIVAWLPAAQRQAVLDDALSPSMPDNAISIELGAEDASPEPVHLSWLSDGLNAHLDQAVKRLKENVQRVNRDPQAFIEQMLSVAPQALIVMLPLFALLLKLFYLFKRRLYMEHLLVALHSHSFIALALLAIILLDALAGTVASWSWLASGLQWLITLLWLWIPLNLFLTQKRVYAEGWSLTSVKFLVIGSLYLVLLTAVSVLTVLLSLLLW